MVSNIYGNKGLNIDITELNQLRKMEIEVENIVEATVVEIKENKARLEFCIDDIPPQEIYIKNLKASMQDIKVGDKIIFEVKSIEKNKVELKPVGIKTEGTETSGSIKRMDMLKSMLSKINVEITKEHLQIANIIDTKDIELNYDTFYEVEKLKNSINKIVNNITKKKVEVLKKYEISLDKITIDILTDILDSVEDISEEKLKTKVEEKLNTKLENIEVSTNNLDKLVLGILEDNDLPKTKSNINYIKNVIKQITEVKALGELDLFELIKKDEALSLENLYKARYTNGGSNKQQKQIEIPNLEEKIIKTLNAQSIEASRENIMVAKAFVEHEIDITDINIRAYKALYNAVKKVDNEYVLKEAVKNIRANAKHLYLNEELKEIDIKKTNDKVENIKAKLNGVDDNAIKRVISKKEIINIKNLIKETRISSSDSDKYFEDNENVNLKVIRAKREIEEIRLRLTTESAIKLKDKGINIETEPIRKVVESMKELEQKAELELDGQKIVVESSKIEKLQNLYGKLDKLKSRELDIYANFIKSKIPLTIKNIVNEQELQQKNNMEELKHVENVDKNVDKMEKNRNPKINMYEKQETKADLRLGDSFKKIENQIEDILKSQNIEVTEINVKCAKILIKNDLEVSIENIEAIKIYEDKLQTVIDKLNPIISLEMLKESINPVEIHLDEIISYIKAFNEKYGVANNDNLYNAIAEMKDKNIISDEEKDALVAIYKAINIINKADDMAIGHIVKNYMPVTIKNLLEATKYMQAIKYKDENINIVVNDAVGILKELKNSDDSVLGKINKVLEEANWGSEKVNNFIKDIKEIQNVKENILYALKKYSIPVNKENIDAFKKSFENINYQSGEFEKLSKVLEKTGEKLKDDFKTSLKENIDNLKKKLQDGDIYEDIRKKLEAIKDEYKDNDFNKKEATVQKLEDLQKLLKINEAVSKQEDYYQIPIYLGDRITNLNIYFYDEKNKRNEGTNKNTNILLAMDTEALGEVSVDIKVKGNSIDMKISNENKQSTEFIKDNISEIYKLIENLGYKINKISWQNQKITNPVIDKLNNEIRLYKDSRYEQVV